MSRKNLTVLVVSALLLMLCASMAQASFGTGSMMYPKAVEVLKFEKRQPCNLGEVQFFMGYVAGIFDGSRVSKFKGVPDNVSVGHLASIVAHYIVNHPERGHESAALLAILAIWEKYPNQ